VRSGAAAGGAPASGGFFLASPCSAAGRSCALAAKATINAATTATIRIGPFPAYDLVNCVRGKAKVVQFGGYCISLCQSKIILPVAELLHLHVPLGRLFNGQ
jgi:hypothetical protein